LIDHFLDWLAGLPSLMVYAILVAVSAVENVFPPVPADVAVVLGAFLSTRGVTSAPLLGTLCWLANTASSAGIYFVARARGEAFFRSGWRRKLLPPEAKKALRDAYRRHGVLGIFVCRFLPGIRAAVTPFAGVAGMSAPRVLIPSAAASAIWYAVLVVVGSALGLNWERAKRLIDHLNRGLGVVALLVVALLVYWLWRLGRSTAEDG
jgi:membrane protein DedA with SNARE-associated domain